MLHLSDFYFLLFKKTTTKISALENTLVCYLLKLSFETFIHLGVNT